MEYKPYLRKVQFYETDAMGIVHHSNYVRWMEEARTDLMEQAGYPYEKCSVEHHVDLGVTSIQGNYKGMTRFGDTVRIEASITHLSNARLTVGYRVYDNDTGALRFEGESGHFFYDNQTGRVVALKKVVPELFALFSSLCEGADYDGNPRY